MKRLVALANLAAFCILHGMRAAVAFFGGKKRGAEAFHAQFGPEGIFALSPAEQAAMPRAQACILCGLCDMGAGASEWHAYGKEALVAGFARALPVLPLAYADVARAADRLDAAALCPMGVPLDGISAFLTRPRA